MTDHWIADRTRCFDASGIRRVFELGAKLTDPVNLSIGQPDFDVPDEVKRAAIEAIEQGSNGYALSQGMPGGGYILSSACSVAPGVKPSRLTRMVELAEQYGRYGGAAQG